MSAPIEIDPRDRLFVFTGARRKLRDNNGLCGMVQFSQFHTRGGGDAGLSHAALPASMRINLRLCKTARSTDCWGGLQVFATCSSL
jgi:hypothetical protein